MKKAGFRRVRPLEGGLRAWRGHGFPLEDIPREIDVAIISPSDGGITAVASKAASDN